jgi:hypothetical protein
LGDTELTELEDDDKAPSRSRSASSHLPQRGYTAFFSYTTTNNVRPSDVPTTLRPTNLVLSAVWPRTKLEALACTVASLSRCIYFRFFFPSPFCTNASVSLVLQQCDPTRGAPPSSCSEARSPVRSPTPTRTLAQRLITRPALGIPLTPTTRTNFSSRRTRSKSMREASRLMSWTRNWRVRGWRRGRRRARSSMVRLRFAVLVSGYLLCLREDAGGARGFALALAFNVVWKVDADACSNRQVLEDGW